MFTITRDFPCQQNKTLSSPQHKPKILQKHLHVTQATIASWTVKLNNRLHLLGLALEGL